MIGRITVILLLFASSCFGQTRGHGFFWGQSSVVSSGPDTLTLTYWDDFVLLHIANTGITEDANGVSQWQDRSGNGNHSTQSVNTNKPSTDGSGNVVFDGVGDYLDNVSLLTSTTDSSFTFFAVYEIISTDNASIMDVWNYADTYNGFIVGLDSTTNSNEFEYSFYYFEDSSGVLTVQADTGSINTTYLHTVAASENTDVQIRVNATQISDIAITGAFNRGGSSSAYYLSSNSTSRFTNIRLKFMGVSDRKFTPAEIATTESELNSFFTIY